MGVHDLPEGAPRGGDPDAPDADPPPPRSRGRPGLRRGTQVTIWEQDLGPGRLPSVCFLTGRDTTHWASFSFLTVPLWMRVLVVPAIFLRLGLVHHIAARVLGASARGRLPVTRGWWWTFALLRWGRRGLLGAAVFLVGWALLSTGNPRPDLLLSLAAASLLGWALLAWVAWPALRPRGRVRRQAGATWVELNGVHPRFATALGRLYQGSVMQGDPGMSGRLGR